MKWIIILIGIMLTLMIIDDIAYKSPYDIRIKECQDYRIKADIEQFKSEEVDWKYKSKHLKKAIGYLEEARSCYYTVYPLVWGSVYGHFVPFKWSFTKIIEGLR